MSSTGLLQESLFFYKKKTTHSMYDACVLAIVKQTWDVSFSNDNQFTTLTN